MTDEEPLPVWEKFYQIVSGSNQHVTTEIIDQTLSICRQKLVHVLLEFKPYTKESFDKWKKSLSMSDDEMSSFIHRLSKDLDLDVNLAWSVICNFLIFRYYGKVDELKFIIRYEANVKSFIDHVWYFYSADRMFFLKTLRFIFEKVSDPNHIFYNKFKSFIKDININTLWENLINSFEILIREIDTEKSNRVSSDILARWIRRNNREQSEVLLLMIHIVDIVPLTGDELTRLLQLFLKHGFGRHALFFGAESESRPKDIEDIKYAETGVILTVVKRYWSNKDFWKMIPKQVERDLEHYQMQSDDGLILFIWAVFKVSISEDHLEYCTNALEALIMKNIFNSLYKCISLNIFQNCKVGEIVMEGTNKLFIELLKCSADYTYFYEKEGVVKIICELYKRPQLKAIDHFGKFLAVGLEMFPFILDNFLDMVEAVITLEDYYGKVLKLIHNCPSYCTELEWPFASDRRRTDQDQNLFLGTDRFIIPKGTLAEKCNCYGVDMVKYKYKYDYFQVIEQYMRSLTMWAINRGEYNQFILNCVLRGYKFISFLIKHYIGNFHHDRTVRNILQQLDCVPSFYSKGGLRNFDFFYTYFEVKCTAFMYQDISMDEVFPIIVRKSLFPFVTNYSEAREELQKFQITNDSILYSFLKEEESVNEHKLLLMYTEFVLNILKKKVLYKEILYGSLWYLLNVVFVTHQQWSYNGTEPYQDFKILNACLKVFTTILQENYQDIEHNEDERELYLLVQDSFLKNECVVNSLCSLFIKDKFYLYNFLHQESNWIAGQTLVVVDSIKLQLTLLLLIFKSRARIPKEPCIIDHRTTIFAKSASLYFVNPYNCTLAVLAGRFLDILARDEDIPLMACLELDHDQIQTLFLERLRDPMEDDDVKCNILDLISTCVKHQTALTAAFFNIQCSKKWYDSDSKRKVERDTVANFMIDYLDNIEKSVAYLQSPLQVGILRVMTILWQSQRPHLITDIIAIPHFWKLLCDPLYKTYEQAPLVYYYILKILSIQCMLISRKGEADKEFTSALETFLLNKDQLKLFQQYLFKIFSKPVLPKDALENRRLLIETWAELLIIQHNQKLGKSLRHSESGFCYVQLCFEGIQIDLVHKNILSTWLDLTVVVFDIFGLKFESKFSYITKNVISFMKIINMYYEHMSLVDKSKTLTIVLNVMTELKEHYENASDDLTQLLDEIGVLMDYEHELLEQNVWKMLREEHPEAPNAICPWGLFISIANFALTLQNSKCCTVWFANRRYLNKMIPCTCNLLSYKPSLAAGKIALFSLTLYAQSPLAFDFLKVNMLQFYDKIEPMINTLLTGQFSKINVPELKEAWKIFTLVIKFNQAFIRKFQKNALEVCYSFLTLNEHILRHIMNIPENTVDLAALDLVLETLIFYNDILEFWALEWYRKSNKTYSFMIDGVRKIINACTYLCLKPNHIVIYYLDDYDRMLPLQRQDVCNNLMATVMNRVIAILDVAFKCLYRLNSTILQFFDVYDSGESSTILISNDFSVPSFELPVSCELTYGKLFSLVHFLCKNLSISRKNKQACAPSEDDCYDYIGLIKPQDHSQDMRNQKLTSIVRSRSYEDTGNVGDPWINRLDPENVRITADALMIFIGQQTFLTLKEIEHNKLIYYKSNLSSELQVFNEFVKKQTAEYLEAMAPLKPSAPFTPDMDVIKRYLTLSWEHNLQGDVAKNNFLLVMSFWFTNICQIH